MKYTFQLLQIKEQIWEQGNTFPAVQLVIHEETSRQFYQLIKF